MLGDTRTIGTQSYVTAYSYDSAGRLNGVTYPPGTLLSYSLDALGRVQRISANREGVALRATLSIPVPLGVCLRAAKRVCKSGCSAAKSRNRCHG